MLGVRGLRINETGATYGRLTVLRYDGLSRWWCRCECGKEVLRHMRLLRDGASRSCGCLRREVSARRRTTHGLSHKVPEYIVWCGIRQRCNDPGCRIYKHYGGRGISMCERWNDFAAFYADMGQRPSNKYWIERIDNDGNYEPGNCKWELPAVQALNTRQNVRINGIVGSKAIAASLGITEAVLTRRRAHGTI